MKVDFVFTRAFRALSSKQPNPLHCNYIMHFEKPNLFSCAIVRIMFGLISCIVSLKSRTFEQVVLLVFVFSKYFQQI